MSPHILTTSSPYAGQINIMLLHTSQKTALITAQIINVTYHLLMVQYLDSILTSPATPKQPSSVAFRRFVACITMHVHPLHFRTSHFPVFNTHFNFLPANNWSALETPCVCIEWKHGNHEHDGKECGYVTSWSCLIPAKEAFYEAGEGKNIALAMTKVLIQSLLSLS